MEFKFMQPYGRLIYYGIIALQRVMEHVQIFRQTLKKMKTAINYIGIEHRVLQLHAIVSVKVINMDMA